MDSEHVTWWSVQWKLFRHTLLRHMLIFCSFHLYLFILISFTFQVHYYLLPTSVIKTTALVAALGSELLLAWPLQQEQILKMANAIEINLFLDHLPKFFFPKIAVLNHILLGKKYQKLTRKAIFLPF